MTNDAFEAKPTEVRIEGRRAVACFDEKVVKALSESVSGVSFGHFCIYVPYKDDKGEEKFEHVTIGHERPEDEKKGTLAITARRPETLQAVLKGLRQVFK